MNYAKNSFIAGYRPDRNGDGIRLAGRIRGRARSPGPGRGARPGGRGCAGQRSDAPTAEQRARLRKLDALVVATAAAATDGLAQADGHAEGGAEKAPGTRS